MTSYEEELRNRIPSHTLAGIDRYVNEHIATGGFLDAVLSNKRISKLFEALGRADDCNRACLFEICEYIYNYIPAEAWGSPAKVQNWLSTRGQNEGGNDE